MAGVGKEPRRGRHRALLRRRHRELVHANARREGRAREGRAEDQRWESHAQRPNPPLLCVLQPPQEDVRQAPETEGDYLPPQGDAETGEVVVTPREQDWLIMGRSGSAPVSSTAAASSPYSRVAKVDTATRAYDHSGKWQAGTRAMPCCFRNPRRRTRRGLARRRCASQFCSSSA